MNMDGYQALANAIVRQAADDYCAVLIRLRKRPNDRELRFEKRRLEHFFHSGWYDTLTNVDPKQLMKALQAKADGRIRVVRSK